jgi:pimeloyl-[acyl-carrier protein] synthase
VHWNALFQRWIVTRHSDFIWGMRNHDVFSSCFPRFREPREEHPPIDEADWDLAVPLAERWDPFVSRDRPEHLEMRQSIHRWFTPKAVEQWRSALRETAHDLIAARRADGRMEVKADLATPLALLTVSWMLGIPLSDAPKLTELTNRFLSPGFGPDRLRTKFETVVELDEYFSPLIEARTRNPGDDLISILAEAEQRGIYTRNQCVSSVAQIMMAGHETTTSTISNGLLAFIRNPDQWDLLRSNPEGLAALAAEECLRYEPSIKEVMRISTQDVEIGGKVIGAGDHVSFMIPGANRDPRAFSNPEAFDITRSPNPHVSFGGGIHHCLGAALARVELQEAFRALAQHIARPQLANGDVEYIPNLSLRQVSSLEVCWN